MRVVKPRATSLASTPRKVAALKSRAPSRWVGRPWAWAKAWTAFCTSRGTTRPPARLWVFSRAMRPVGA